MLVVVEDRHVEQFAQALLDLEAFGRLDVFQVDAAEAVADRADAVDHRIDVFGVHFDVDAVDVGKPLEQDPQSTGL